MWPPAAPTSSPSSSAPSRSTSGPGATRARRTAGSSWRTLVDGPAGAIVGTYVRADGTEALVNTVDTNEWSLHGHVLFGGMLEWVTRGTHLGSKRNYLGIDVDDVFLPDDRWNIMGHATPRGRLGHGPHGPGRRRPARSTGRPARA